MRKWNEYIIVPIVLAIIVAAWCVGGCQNRIEGGTSLDQQEAAELEYDGRVLRYKDSRAYTATTQPSVTGDGKLFLDGVSAGIKPVSQMFKANWPLAVGFWGAAAFLYYVARRILPALILFALGVMAVVWPAALAILALAAFAVGVWAVWRNFKETTSGVTKAFETMSVEDVETFKALMRTKQSSGAQKAVKATK